ncbi:leucine-rich repeat domain-containing protein [Streptomyces kaniharaensis]|uniref:Leucine-rich repeat domain-containing protein n=1 Tax=Streptomyces kaniharaensis TaxID=212423 RepID=A0A6N7L6L0_9ACTN|nr:STM4015 family protein [Streptomyces kaniharaensis]MQS17813.1 leucine-rich repeat domain-containing protein [Streptomyces kaniharaensis]
MTVNHHLGHFHDLPVHSFTPGAAAQPAADAVAWRIALEYDAACDFAELWSTFLDTVDPATVRAVVIGSWWQRDYEPVKAAVAAIADEAERLPALEALFLGDVTYDECEISWLEMSDVTLLLTVFPSLTEFSVRGGTDLRLSPVRHDRLRSLRFEAGGLPSPVVRAVAASELPVLEELVLWLGVDEYGGDATIDDLGPFLDGARFPVLRHLGLANSEFQDEIASALAHAPVVARLETLDLSMGVLSDEGAAALLEGQPLTHLRAIDLHHHYLTEEMQERLREALPGVEVDLSEAEDEGEDPEDRYVAVAE